jgi:hypothetical protein
VEVVLGEAAEASGVLVEVPRAGVEPAEAGNNTLWSAAACCRFRSGQLAGRALESDTWTGAARASSREKSGSKLPHSKIQEREP